MTFNSTKGVGEFRSIVMASPELDPADIESEDDAHLTKKGSLGIIAVNLFAMTLEPKLIIDRKLRHDG